MADFGPSATQLTGPQGAGTQAIAPVQEQAVTVNYMEPLGKIADIFAKGLQMDAKETATKLQQGVVGSYVREVQVLNDGVASGQIKPEVAATRSRAIYGKYAAGSPQYLDDLFKARTALAGGSELGAVEDAVKIDADRQKHREATARQNGAIIAPWMDKATIEAQLQTAEATSAANDAFTRRMKIAQENRAVGAEERIVQDRELKRESMALMNTLAEAQLPAVSMAIRDIKGKVDSGAMNPQQAALALEESFFTINQAFNKAGEGSPETISHFRSMFDGMKEAGRKALDPKSNLAEMDNEIKRIINVQKLTALADPRIQKLVASNELLGNNAVTALGSLSPITEFLAKATTSDSLQGQHVPQIVGNPDVEKDVLNFLRPAIGKINTKAYGNQVKAETEAVLAVNNVLKQTGDMLNDPNARRDPKKFGELAKFFSSPEYGQFATSGKINLEAANAAKFTWQSMYVPAVRNEVQTRLDEFLYGSATFGRGSNTTAPKTISEAVDVVFSGSGIQFTPKGGKSLDPVERTSQQEAVSTLNSSQAAVNQLIKIGAHLEGSTDYKSYWEANKYSFMPQLYPARAGVIVNGYKSKGGLGSDPSNWVKVEK